MSKFYVIIVSLILSVSIYAEKIHDDKLSADIILKKSAAKYKSLKTYSDTGTIQSEVVYNGIRNSINISFKILMQKPDLYLISWSQTNSMIPIPQNSTIWSTGKQTYRYINTLRAFSKLPNAKYGLAASAGISNGITNFIPSLFFEFFYNSNSFFSKLINPELIKIEQIDGDECYVINSSSSFSKKITLWISKSTLLIRKSKKLLSSSIKTPTENPQKKEEKSLFNLSSRKNNASEKKTNELNGFAIETHNNISFPELQHKDFDFKIPKGAVLKQSLLK